MGMISPELQARLIRESQQYVQMIGGLQRELHSCKNTGTVSELVRLHILATTQGAELTQLYVTVLNDTIIGQQQTLDQLIRNEQQLSAQLNKAIAQINILSNKPNKDDGWFQGQN